jgi:hypothetical protein
MTYPRSQIIDGSAEVSHSLMQRTVSGARLIFVKLECHSLIFDKSRPTSMPSRYSEKMSCAVGNNEVGDSWVFVEVMLFFPDPVESPVYV